MNAYKYMRFKRGEWVTSFTTTTYCTITKGWFRLPKRVSLKPEPESYADYSTFGWSSVISWILNLKGFYRLAQSSGTHQMLVLFECSQFLSCRSLREASLLPTGPFLSQSTTQISQGGDKPSVIFVRRGLLFNSPTSQGFNYIFR